MFFKHADRKYICCNNNPSNECHIIICTMELDCGHSACVRCLLKTATILEWKSQLFIQCNICMTNALLMPDELFSKQITTIWQSNDLEIKNFIKQNVLILNGASENVQNTKG